MPRVGYKSGFGISRSITSQRIAVANRGGDAVEDNQQAGQNHNFANDDFALAPAPMREALRTRRQRPKVKRDSVEPPPFRIPHSAIFSFPRAKS